MKIVYLPSCAQDFAWFRHYYTTVFPAGDENAKKAFAAIQSSLSANPYIGYPFDDFADVYELRIPRVPFTLYYRVTRTQIEVLRLWDERQKH